MFLSHDLLSSVSLLIYAAAIIQNLLQSKSSNLVPRKTFRKWCQHLVRVGRSAESRIGQRVIGSKAEVMWYYESVANHSLATPSASDSHCYAFWNRYYSVSCPNLRSADLPTPNSHPLLPKSSLPLLKYIHSFSATSSSCIPMPSSFLALNCACRSEVTVTSSSPPPVYVASRYVNANNVLSKNWERRLLTVLSASANIDVSITE